MSATWNTPDVKPDVNGFVWVRREMTGQVEMAWFDRDRGVFEEIHSAMDRGSDTYFPEYMTDVTHWAEMIPPAFTSGDQSKRLTSVSQ